MLRNARNRATREGVPFAITVDDIVIPERCPILDLRLAVSPGRGGADCSPSLDRLNPIAGYVPGNITVVSNKANRLKSQLSPEQLVMFARAYYNHYLNIREQALETRRL